VFLAGLLAAAPALDAKTKKPKAAKSNPDLQVAAHIPLSSGTVTGFIISQHTTRYYLYAEHQGAKTVTLIDVTRANRPSVLADFSYSSQAPADSVAALAGTAALVTSEPVVASSAPAPQSVKILDFSNPENPKVVREFTGVTAFGRDEGRGLIFVANAEGIWVLQQRRPEEEEAEDEYTRYVLYSH